MLSAPPPATGQAPRFLVMGRESVGKSELVGALAGSPGWGSNWAGATSDLRTAWTADATLVDSPGIFRRSDSDATRIALAALEREENVILVVQATRIDEDLELLLPLVVGRQGLVAVTFWDKVHGNAGAEQALARLTASVGVPFVAVDARALTARTRALLRNAFRAPSTFRGASAGVRVGWHLEPAPGWLDHPRVGPVLAAGLLLFPALATVFGANRLADALHPGVEAVLAPLITAVDLHAPAWARLVLTSRSGEFGYGLLNMGPFLVVWALPTVLLFALVLGVYKASGLMDRVGVALHPWVLPLGLSGRDLTRVAMGFGCNVPAVVSTRSCSACSRETAVAAIAFGSACSYQLPATLAVFAANATSTGQPAVLACAYVGYLFVTSAVYLRLTAPAEAKNPLNVLVGPPRPFMQWPSLRALRREAGGVVRQFVLQALPVFAGICVVASLLAASGVLDALSAGVGPMMAIFRLPADAALPVVLASVRKDGILLFASVGEAGAPLSGIQLLTGVYLAGVLLPCVVTALTMGRELSWRRAGRVLARQAAFAVACSVLLAWCGAYVLLLT